MNTPKKPKDPKRWSAPKEKPGYPDGSDFGIMNESMAAAYGRAVSYWWYVEDAMIWLLADLVSGGDIVSMSVDSAEGQLFRSIVSNDARIKLMRSLLATAKRNQHRPLEFDEIIDEFERLNKRRNSLVHGIWRTDPKSQVVTVAKSTPQGHAYEVDVVIDNDDLNGLLEDMRKLYTRIFDRHPETHMIV